MRRLGLAVVIYTMVIAAWPWSVKEALILAFFMTLFWLIAEVSL